MDGITGMDLGLVVLDLSEALIYDTIRALLKVLYT